MATESIVNENFYSLKIGSLLNNRFEITGVLGEGGFGITYLGIDKKLDRQVAIKEYFPSKMAFRNHEDSVSVSIFSGPKGQLYRKQLSKFLREAKRAAQFSKSAGIVDIIDYFEENNTAYMVMEFLDGNSLGALLDEKGKLTEEETLQILRPVIFSLRDIHNAKLIHRDIAPDNIMFNGNIAKLIDFGASADLDEEQSNSSAIIVKACYVPEEQYDSARDRQGPWTDVYALCATIYKCLTGDTIPNALDRLRGVIKLKPLPDNIKNGKIIMKGLEVNPKDRLQSVDELIEAFYPNSTDTPVFRKRLPKGAVIGIISALAVAAAACLVIFLPGTSLPAAEEVPQTEVTAGTTAVTTAATIAETLASNPADWEYTGNPITGYFWITKYTGDYGDSDTVQIVLPTEIDGNAITWIDSNAFSSNTEEKTIYLTVPDTYTHVANKANTDNFSVILENVPENFKTSDAWRWLRKEEEGKTFPLVVTTAPPTETTAPGETTVVTTEPNYAEDLDYYVTIGLGPGKYTGDIKDGIPDGNGVYTSSNGSYDGEWKNGLPNGQGTIIQKNSTDREYTGGFVDGKFEGTGVLKRSDGSRLEGEFKNNMGNGRMIEYTPVNTWDDWQMQGTFTENEGEQINGIWVGNVEQRRIKYDGAIQTEYIEVAEDGHWLGSEPSDPLTIRHFIEVYPDGRINEWDDVYVNGERTESINHTHTEPPE
jgi:serine/threonine protein kinase